MCASPVRRSRGFSLVEVLIGMVIALLVGLAASSSARMFGAAQRQGVGVGGMTVNAATALAALKSDAASAGLGFFADSVFLCHKLDFSVGAAVKFDNADFSPVKITRNSGNDQLEVMYGSEVDAGAVLYLKGPSNGATAALGSLMPVVAGQAVLLAPDPKDRLGNRCLLRSATANTPSTDLTEQVVSFGSVGANSVYNQAAFTTPPSFLDRDRAALLGNLRWVRYRKDGTNLRLDRLLDGTSAVVVRNVMAFRVQYGVADAGQTSLTGWQDATVAPWLDLKGADVSRVRALRIGLLTRSPQREKANAEGQCEATTAKPRDPLDPSLEVTPDVTDWQCYRYRSAVVVVPLRNLAW